MNNCWAEKLGGCGGGISREHIISGSLFESSCIDVKGFDWCKEEKRIGLASLTKKVLCRNHNSQLSQIDSAAAYAFDVFRRTTRQFNDRNKKREEKYKKIIFPINAAALERWFLKTLINICFGTDYFIGPTSSEKGCPSNDLVRIAFGKDKFGAKNGMSVAAKVGGKINSKDTVSFAPIIKDNSCIHGGTFSFRGVFFFIDLSSDGLSVPFHELPFMDKEWRHLNLMPDLEQIKLYVGNRLSHVVKFNW